ncbi:NAD(P)H:quinone oxidoreductase, type IV [Salipiger sp. IMCC34102]|uniref:NAD(P)H-dependent oxidoreductase n=1 Tax=Salipiger sp. IMCC34102 TaxID=2510647 RepID=UPI00101BBEBF|nr:NAD(P)H-dependent oxidoreductase [Salipiger sp. IMCC34102]RYH02148.1 NAD(P)H:quinone oxidoreductase, type IV [Salipiger sp. IMCC34102]
MASPKIAIFFYSTYGTNHSVALEAKAAAEAAGAEVRLAKIPETAPQSVIDGQDAWKAQQERAADIPEATPDDVEWADGLWFSGPVRFGGQSSQVRAFIDTLGGLWGTGILVNKTITATTSAQNPNGGVENTLMNLYHAAMHWGAIPVVPGYSDEVKFEDGGNAYGYSMVGGNDLTDVQKRSIAHQSKRLVEITAKINS